MNDYRVTFTPEGREETETAHITERTEAAARKAFVKRFGKEAELHGIELAAVNTNATKEQEREALEKIRAMVAELGPDSYLKTAFDGVFEDAEQNIEFDAAFSMKGRVESAERQVIELKDKLSASRSDVEILRSQLEHAESKLRANNAGVEELIQKDDERKEALLGMNRLLAEARTSAGEAQRRAEEAETQVIQLKAKLYDYMTA